MIEMEKQSVQTERAKNKITPTRPLSSLYIEIILTNLEGMSTYKIPRRVEGMTELLTLSPGDLQIVKCKFAIIYTHTYTTHLRHKDTSPYPDLLAVLVTYHCALNIKINHIHIIILAILTESCCRGYVWCVCVCRGEHSLDAWCRGVAGVGE